MIESLSRFWRKHSNEMQPNSLKENSDKPRWNLQRSNDGLQEMAKSMDLKSNQFHSHQSLKYRIRMSIIKANWLIQFPVPRILISNPSEIPDNRESALEKVVKNWLGNAIFLCRNHEETMKVTALPSIQQFHKTEIRGTPAWDAMASLVLE
jgi:hypothetical protein